MTFEQVKNILLDLRAARRRANAIKARMAELQGDAESINSALSGNLPGGSVYSRVEELALRIEAEREKHIAALETYFAIEDKLSAAVATLDPIEQDIIIGCYMDGKYNWQVGDEMNYSEVYVRKIKRRAIDKLSKKL